MMSLPLCWHKVSFHVIFSRCLLLFPETKQNCKAQKLKCFLFLFLNFKLPSNRLWKSSTCLFCNRKPEFFFSVWDTVNRSLTCASVSSVLPLCCQLKATHALVSHGTKCVIIAEAVAHSLCSFTSSTPALCRSLLTADCKVNCEWHWRGNLMSFCKTQ